VATLCKITDTTAFNLEVTSYTSEAEKQELSLSHSIQLSWQEDLPDQEIIAPTNFGLQSLGEACYLIHLIDPNNKLRLFEYSTSSSGTPTLQKVQQSVTIAFDAPVEDVNVLASIGGGDDLTVRGLIYLSKERKQLRWYRQNEKSFSFNDYPLTYSILKTSATSFDLFICSDQPNVADNTCFLFEDQDDFSTPDT